MAYWLVFVHFSVPTRNTALALLLLLQTAKCELCYQSGMTCGLAAFPPLGKWAGVVGPTSRTRSGVPRTHLSLSKGGEVAEAKAAASVEDPKPERALFGMGCFWNPQEDFGKVPGVVSTRTGYAKVRPSDSDSDPDPTSQTDRPKSPSYFSVCRGDGNTEAVLVEYDPSIVSYKELLRTFWENHDASAQYPSDKAVQYRSVVWALTDDQRDMAAEDLQNAKDAYEREGMAPPSTVVSDAASTDVGRIFAPAESIHQNFWPKLQLKLVLIVAATLLKSPDLPAGSLVAAKVVTAAVLLWWGWEVLEMGGSAAASLGFDSPLAVRDR